MIMNNEMIIIINVEIENEMNNDKMIMIMMKWWMKM